MDSGLVLTQGFGYTVLHAAVKERQHRPHILLQTGKWGQSDKSGSFASLYQ